jgi:hexosaminidase
MSRPALLAAVAWFALVSVPAQAAPEPAVIPQPASITRLPGEFRIRDGTALVVAPGEEAVRRIAADFAALAQRTYGLNLPVVDARPREPAIQLRLEGGAGKGPEAYRLEARRGGIVITAPAAAGLVHGTATLWQLIDDRRPGRRNRGDGPGPNSAVVPAIVVEDAPRFAWRGIMLDSARHFQSPEFIRQYLDWMALHKLNVLHWHLTDDQAWRLEIRKYPRLTEVGAWRVPAGPAAAADTDPATGKPRLYGGYYSQETVRSLVAYAAERGITIVPEIEMPGHASAAIAAYPALASTDSPPTAVPSDWGIYHHAFNLDESTFAFLEDVLGEVMALFPGRYIHVGGDEVDKTEWRESPRVQARMRELGIDDVAKVQAHFTQRIARFLESRGRRLVGWDEILEPGLPASAVVMSWRGVDGALAAAAKGYDTVIAAHPTLYFDNRQSTARDEPPGRARVVSVKDVYDFEPMPAAIPASEQRHVLGLQGNVWTEHIRTEERVATMTFPRAAAIAELGWSPAEKRDWESFVRRIAALSPRYAALGLARYDTRLATAGKTRPLADPRQRVSHELQLCSDNIALALEDDAPVRGKRAVFLVDIQNPCWIFKDAPLDGVTGVVASVGQVPFNFQIGEDVNKIRFPKPSTPEGELEVRLGNCEGELLARLPLAPAAPSPGVSTLPRAALAPHAGHHDLCLRFAQPGVDPMWVIDSIRLVGGRP